MWKCPRRVDPCTDESNLEPFDALQAAESMAHRESCISHEDPTLAVLAWWWRALEANDPELLNDQLDPP